MARMLRYRVRAKGKNLSFLLGRMAKENIGVYDVKRDGNAIEFLLSPRGYATLKSLDFDDMEFEVTKVGGRDYVLHLFLSNIGFAVGIIASIVIYLAISSRIFYISISGLERTQKMDVLNSLERIGVQKFATMPSDMDALTEYLSSEFDFSIVSAIRRGNALVINVKEELDDVVDFEEITAEYDMVINSIEVYSGTANVKAGDIVKRGDVLVSPHMLVGGEVSKVEPKAKIIATRFISKTYNFLSEETRVERTGESVVVSSEYCLGEHRLYEKTSGHDFEFFELECEDKFVSYYFLLIRVKREVAYEVCDVIVSHNFDDEKDEIIERLKQECYLEVGGESVLDEKCDIIPMDFGYTINYHISLNVYLEY